MEEPNLRKHTLFRLLIHSCLSNVPTHLWTNHRSEIEAMRKYQKDDWTKTDYFNMGLRHGDGPVYEWLKTQAREIWENGTNEWYEREVKPWVEREKIVW